MATISIDVPDEALPVIQAVFEQLLSSVSVEPGPGMAEPLPPAGPEGMVPPGPAGPLPPPEAALPAMPMDVPMNPDEMALAAELDGMRPNAR